MGRRARLVAAALWVSLAQAAAAAAQSPAGHVSIFTDYLPERRHTTEIRARAFAEDTLDPSPWLRINLSGFIEALVARRPDRRAEGTSSVRSAVFEVRDANVELRAGRLDVLVGYTRVVWGRLDELQPTDVVNPIDASRFFFEGRGEARLAVLAARARVSLAERAVLDGVYVPRFRRGRYDLLDDETSPFNVVRTTLDGQELCAPAGCTLRGDEPAFRLSHAQGGARLSVTTGRVDWSVAAWRGFEPFGIVAFDATASGAPVFVERYPRVTMIGGDFETVAGAWGLRGEIAVFTEDAFQSADLNAVEGRSVDAGFGFDRRAGDLTVSGTVVLHAEFIDRARPGTVEPRRDLTLVASADRTFARARYRLRAFAVYNPSEATGFLRGIGMTSLRDNLGLEGSLGWFGGRGRDLVGRFADNDFAYVRLRYYF